MDILPPQRRACVVVCSDANWAWQSLFVLMRSIRFDTAGQLDHHLYLTGEVDPRILAIVPDTVTLHPISELPESFYSTAKGHIPAAAMLRFVALEELAGVYERVIYLDGDVFQSWGSLANLLDVEMSGATIAAVRDRAQWQSNMRRRDIAYINKLADHLGMSELDYFNSGVLMVDSCRFIAAEVLDRAVEFIQRQPHLCQFGDQTALNVILAGKWCELSPTWNWQRSRISAPLIEGRHPRLIHFTGGLKPWNDTYRLGPLAAFWEMFDFLYRHDIIDFLGEDSPLHFNAHMHERIRARKLDDLWSDISGKRNKLKAYLDRTDFADIQAGIPHA